MIIFVYLDKKIGLLYGQIIYILYLCSYITILNKKNEEDVVGGDGRRAEHGGKRPVDAGTPVADKQRDGQHGGVAAKADTTAIPFDTTTDEVSEATPVASGSGGGRHQRLRTQLRPLRAARGLCEDHAEQHQ